MDNGASISQAKPTTNRVLLVDDEPAVLRGLKRLLTGARPDWELACARNGQEALDSLRLHHFHAVLLDLQMPVMDGLTCLLHLVHHYPEVKRIVHSSRIDSLGACRVPRLAHAVLSKPAAPDRILSVLDAALQHQEHDLACSAGASA